MHTVQKPDFHAVWAKCGGSIASQAIPPLLALHHHNTDHSHLRLDGLVILRLGRRRDQLTALGLHP